MECLSRSVCLSVCLQHNSKTNDPKVFKLGRGNIPCDTLDMVVLFWGSKVKGQGHSVNKCIFHTNARSITQKRMTYTPKCSNLIQGMTLEYPISDMVLG